jgi:hypothetical protein
LRRLSVDSIDRVYLPNPRIAYRKINGDMVIVHTLENKLVRLNPTATVVWENLDGRTIREIAREVCAQFKVDEEEALKDIVDFIDYLIGREFVEVSPVNTESK